MASNCFSCSRKGPRENIWYHTMERASVPYPRLGMERALFHTYGTNLVPYLWNGPLYHTLGWGMRWKSDSEVWNGYGTGMVRSCKISPLIFLIRATPGTWSVPYLWNGRRFHTFWRVWNGPGSIPMERAWFHTYGTNLVPYLPTQVAFPKGILKGIPKGY